MNEKVVSLHILHTYNKCTSTKGYGSLWNIGHNTGQHYTLNSKILCLSSAAPCMSCWQTHDRFMFLLLLFFPMLGGMKKGVTLPSKEVHQHMWHPASAWQVMSVYIVVGKRSIFPRCRQYAMSASIHHKGWPDDMKVFHIGQLNLASKYF